MSRRSRKAAKIWNKYVCPGIEIAVEAISLGAFMVGIVLLTILVVG